MTAVLSLAAQQAFGAFESMQCGLTNPSTGETIDGFDEYNIAEYAGDLADNGQCTVGPGVGVCTRFASPCLFPSSTIGVLTLSQCQLRQHLRHLALQQGRHRGLS